MILTGGVAAIDYEKQCIWELTVTVGEESVTVRYPLTIEFNIVRNTFASSNTATFNIYNLSPSNRDSDFFFQDRFNTDKIKMVTFKAGYNNTLTTVFRGYILESYTKRNGVDVVTSMQCMDLSGVGEYINTTFNAGTTFKEAIEWIVNSTNTLTLGNIGNINGTFKTPFTVEGTPLECLNTICGGHAYIDNNTVNILNNNEGIETVVTEINANSGLLSTPERRGESVVVNSIFNPNYVVGQIINIKSDVTSAFTGTYKVCGISHQGTISGAVAGERITTLNLLIGAFLPNSNYNITGTVDEKFSSVKKDQVTPYNGDVGSSVQAVMRYIRTHNGRVPSTRIIGNITWNDMLGHDNTNAQRLAELNVNILQNCVNVATQLYNFLRQYIPTGRIVITSGWRSVANNTTSKGKATSAHLRGAAIDFRFLNKNTLQMYRQYFYPAWYRYTYYKAQYNIIHVQTSWGAGGARR